MREITDIFNDPRNENTSNAPVENAVTTGKVYYVSNSGDDVNNPGTSINKPFKTIAHAVSKMVAGDKTYVRSGKYSDHVRFGRSGSVITPSQSEGLDDCEQPQGLPDLLRLKFVTG